MAIFVIVITVCLLLRSTFTDQLIKMQHEINSTWRKNIKLLTSSSYPFLFRCFHFLSAHIKIQLLKCELSWSFSLPLAHADDVLLFYSNVHCIVRVNRFHHRTVYTHVVAKFIRSMSHSVTCSDLIGLLKSCCVFWALKKWKR